MSMPVLRPIPFPRMGSWKTLTTYTRTWRVVEKFYLNVPGHPTIVIPADFCFDAASIPKRLRWLLSPVGVLLLPGLVHDYSYCYNCLLCRKDGKIQKYMKCAGKDAFDSLFLEIANHVNGLSFVNKLAYLAVKYFGNSAWESHKGTQEQIKWQR